MTDVIDNALNGTTDVSEVLSGDDLEGTNKSKDENAEEPESTDILDENDSSENPNNMEIDGHDEDVIINDDSNAYPDTSQSDPNENCVADFDADDTEEGEDVHDEKEDKDAENEDKVQVQGELLPVDNENDASIDLSEIEIVPVKSETLDEDTMISQDENELLEDDEEQNHYSGEDHETVLINSINDNDSGASNSLSSTIVKTRPQSRPSSERNGDAREDKPLLTSLLSRGDQSVKSSSKHRNFSISDGNAIAKELEDQVCKLNQLLVLKEKEWSAILRLKKHVEYALDQVKCTQRIAKVQEGLNGPLSTTEIKACMNLIVSDKETFNLAERQIEESIESAENENESLQSVFPFRSDNGAVKENNAHSSKEDTFTATAALQKLCERKRKAMDEVVSPRPTRIRITDVQSNAPQIQSKVIGNGRKGAIVDVQSIIQSHRNLTGDKLPEKQRGKKFTTYTNMINLQPDRQYLKTLEELVAMAEAERQKETTVTLAPPPSASTQVSRSITPKPKNGKPLRQGGNSFLANASSSGGTLAKMLSPSTHSGIGSNRSSNDATSSQKFSTKLPTSDGNLSLANLLATSKLETKVNLSKVKKERNVRDDDSSSQQEAVPICQGCNLSRAQFVCAGCANQWYCSRECQNAYDAAITARDSKKPAKIALFDWFILLTVGGLFMLRVRLKLHG